MSCPTSVGQDAGSAARHKEVTRSRNNVYQHYHFFFQTHHRCCQLLAPAFCVLTFDSSGALLRKFRRNRAPSPPRQDFPSEPIAAREPHRVRGSGTADPGQDTKLAQGPTQRPHLAISPGPPAASRSAPCAGRRRSPPRRRSGSPPADPHRPAPAAALAAWRAQAETPGNGTASAAGWSPAPVPPGAAAARSERRRAEEAAMVRSLNSIVAVCQNMGIGKDGNLPWPPLRYGGPAAARSRRGGRWTTCPSVQRGTQPPHKGASRAVCAGSCRRDDKAGKC